MMLKLLSFMLVLLVLGCDADDNVVRVGAIFNEEDRHGAAEMAFRLAVLKVNAMAELRSSTGLNVSLMYDVQHVAKGDSFRATKIVCKQIERGVLALFGPDDASLGTHIHSVASALHVPYIEARQDVEEPYPSFALNLHPSPALMNQALKDLMSFLNWTRVAIVFEDDLALVRLQDLLRRPDLQQLRQRRGTPEFYVRQATPNNYRTVLREIKRKGIFNILVDTRPEHMAHFFKAILQLQMNNNLFHYTFTSLDVETFDLEDFRYNSVNFSSFRLLDVDSPWARMTLKQLRADSPSGHALIEHPSLIPTSAALMHDAVHIFAVGLRKALSSGMRLVPRGVSCEKELPWEHGDGLMSHLASVQVEGLSGSISFVEGRRSRFKFDLLKLAPPVENNENNENLDSALRKVGQWRPHSGLNVTDPYAFTHGRPPNITLKVLTRLETPFVMLRSPRLHVSNDVMGNARFEGFCMDLLEHISKQVGFNYEMVLIQNTTYGVQNLTTGQWNGLVKELIDGNGDLAMSAMTINYAREAVIDFTKPFMNLGISILFKIPSGKPTRLFSFMNPLAVEIWLYVLAAYVLVSFTLFVMARFSPYEWHAPNHICHDDDHKHNNKDNGNVVSNHFNLDDNNVKGVAKQNQFTVSNSFWFITGTFLRQGSGLNPKAASTRIVGSIWWFFTLIIMSSYTANLAAFLTVERMITPIENAEDLANQKEILYGTLGGGSTMTFFRDSKIDIYKKMWSFMSAHRDIGVFSNTTEDGIAKVREGGYAFLMESTMLDYAVQRDCNLTQVGGLLDSKGYGIATPKGSPWRDRLSLAILELQEKGTIQMLYNKWWKNTGDVCTRHDKSKDSKAHPLSVKNIGGVFVVLICGLSLAIVVAILEFCWNAKRNAQSEHQSLCAEMAQELKFAMRCRGSRQKPALRRTGGQCSPDNTYVPSAFGNGGVPALVSADDASVFSQQSWSVPGLNEDNYDIRRNGDVDGFFHN